MNINATLFGQLIMFGLFVWFCMKFIWPPLVEAMAARKKTIEDGLLAAEQGRAEHAQAQQKAAELIASTKNQAKEIIDNADKQANVMIDNAKGVAVDEADKIKAHAKAELDQEVVRARNELKDQVSTLVMQGVNSVLKKEVDAKAHKDMLSKLSQSLQVQTMELSTIAKPYAQAIFDIAEQGSSHSEWSDLLSTASAIMSDDATQNFVASPNTSKNQKIQLICASLEKAMARGLNAQESAFINLILNNDRTEAMSSIANAFEAAVTNANKGKNFTVVSAYELSDAEKKAIVDDLSAKHNTTVNVDTLVDNTLTGGVVIKEGDKVIDTSIKAKVDALSVCLSVN